MHKWITVFPLLLTALLVGCGKSGSVAPATFSVGKSNGWEIKYTATIALARRGSDKVKEHFDTLAEMLDEVQQQANCKVRNREGQEIVNDQAATSNVTTALKALVELHRRRPEMDLSTFNGTIDKLTNSGNPVLRNEAEKARLSLGQ